MEKHNIGTDASMPVHIANIINREYVKVEGHGRVLLPTDLGMKLITNLRKIDP